MEDFYELFHDDAEVARSAWIVADLRDKNADEPIPMADFHGMVEEHLRTMLRGYKVTVRNRKKS